MNNIKLIFGQKTATNFGQYQIMIFKCYETSNKKWPNSLVFVYCRTSLFITISGLYGLFLVVVCIAFLASEVATHSVPLHYFEVSIMGSNPYKNVFIHKNVYTNSLVDTNLFYENFTNMQFEKILIRHFMQL